MKRWPKDPKETVAFSELVGPLAAALRFGYDMKRRRANRSIPYVGYDIGSKEKVTCVSASESLKAGRLKAQLEEGRDLLEIVLSLTFLMGVEQGRRMLRSSTETELLKMRLDIIIDQIDNKEMRKKIKKGIDDLLSMKPMSLKARYKEIERITRALEAE